eukprot:TRINITY_DN4945_c0_g1_i1.p1 TRINITY_DN4945_c0_g1~~TRINITY_DN4945_c0_g1_i1.p1  ORF type:complete len:422 (-),score=105.39 TRINITY_DN4945_c0_g1_i1:62-1327(-)
MLEDFGDLYPVRVVVSPLKTTWVPRTSPLSAWNLITEGKLQSVELLGDKSFEKLYHYKFKSSASSSSSSLSSSAAAGGGAFPSDHGMAVVLNNNDSSSGASSPSRASQDIQQLKELQEQLSSQDFMAPSLLMLDSSSGKKKRKGYGSSDSVSVEPANDSEARSASASSGTKAGKVVAKPFEVPTHLQRLPPHMQPTAESQDPCPICCAYFKGAGAVRHHMLQNHHDMPPNVRVFECYFCCARFADEQELFSHAAVHEGRQPFQCIACGNWKAQMKSGQKKHFNTFHRRDSSSCIVGDIRGKFRLVRFNFRADGDLFAEGPEEDEEDQVQDHQQHQQEDESPTALPPPSKRQKTSDDSEPQASTASSNLLIEDDHVQHHQHLVVAPPPTLIKDDDDMTLTDDLEVFDEGGIGSCREGEMTCT